MMTSHAPVPVRIHVHGNVPDYVAHQPYSPAITGL